jgi:hypothetical protein
MKKDNDKIVSPEGFKDKKEVKRKIKHGNKKKTK